MGGEAIANGDNVADWEGGQRLVNAAIEAFGDLDILVNNAGILRDRVIVNMTEDEWDAVVAVHLKGHFVPTRWAAAYWREQTKAGVEKPRNIVHTSSTSGLLANPGQTNYGAAKSGIATFSQICAKELVRYGVESNCIAPAARTRLTRPRPASATSMQAPDEAGAFDVWDPANISPLVAYLASGRLRVHRRDVLRAGRHGEAVPVVGDGARESSARTVDGRRTDGRPRQAQLVRSTTQSSSAGHRSAHSRSTNHEYVVDPTDRRAQFMQRADREPVLPEAVDPIRGTQ